VCLDDDLAQREEGLVVPFQLSPTLLCACQ
jgi:hypothetical protein